MFKTNIVCLYCAVNISVKEGSKDKPTHTILSILLGLRTDRWRRPIAMHSIIFPAFLFFLLFFRTQPIFWDRKRAKYSQRPKKINPIYQKFLEDISTRIGGIFFLKILKGFPGGDPTDK